MDLNVIDVMALDSLGPLLLSEVAGDIFVYNTGDQGLVGHAFLSSKHLDLVQVL